MPGRDFIDDLRRDYGARRRQIEQRLSEFRSVFEQGDEAVFHELCYCILTAGSSAKMGMRTVVSLQDILLTGSGTALEKRAEASRVRFWRVRPRYIVQTRDYLRSFCGLKLRDLITSFDGPDERRDFFARNRNIKGLGYKESSHYLRNIGFGGYAILDKHIMSSLHEMKVVRSGLPPKTRSEYLAVERRLLRFSEEIGIDVDHLDLLLWSRRTGEILK
jgi:N-glycosylase/DNA lyase